MLLSWDLRVTVDGRKDVSFPGNNWYVERIEKQILESVVKRSTLTILKDEILKPQICFLLKGIKN